MDKWTPEPWVVRDDVTSRPNWISGEGGEADIAELTGWPCHLHAEEHANAQRIVQCVNALTGLDPSAIPELVGAVERWRDAKDALIAFERRNPNDTTKAWDALFYEVVYADDALRAALAKVKGGAS